MKKTVLFLIVLLAGWMSASGQITYNDSIFAIDRTPVTWARPAGIHMSGYDGISFIGPATWLKLDLSNLASISGSNGYVNLYDADTGIYSILFVECIYHRSDGKAKTDIASLSDSRLSALRPVSFKWKETAGDAAVNQPDINVGSHFGFIAQELETVYPELVEYDDFGNLTVNYTGLIPVLVKSLQEIESHIDSQSAEIDLLMQELTLLKSQSATLKTTVTP